MTSKTPYTPITTATSTTTPPLPPSTSPLTANLDYISRAKRTLYSTLSTRRPWRQILNYHVLSLPTTASAAFSRLKINLSYFRMNFSLIILLILFLSLLWHPLSLVVFLLMLLGWIFLFFLRDEPLVIFRRTIDDRIVIAVLSFFTIFFLLFTGATLNIIISVSAGVAVVLIYSVLRTTEDLYLDEEEAAGSGLLAGRTGDGPGHYSSPR
ncbi:hypothetical protein RND81_04G145500 [Saponaria officinalis]